MSQNDETDGTQRRLENQFPNRDECASFYTKGYPEENCWHLLNDKLDKIESISLDHFYVLFISNEKRQVLLFKEESGEGIVIDYHAVIIGKIDNRTFVFDFDFPIDFPTSLDHYSQNILKNDNNNNDIPGPYRRKYRIVETSVFLHNFVTNRCHMKSKSNGDWLMPPPRQPCIVGSKSNCHHNLHHFTDMSQTKYGVILDDSLHLLSFFQKHLH